MNPSSLVEYLQLYPPTRWKVNISLTPFSLIVIHFLPLHVSGIGSDILSQSVIWIGAGKPANSWHRWLQDRERPNKKDLLINSKTERCGTFSVSPLSHLGALLGNQSRKRLFNALFDCMLVFSMGIHVRQKKSPGVFTPPKRAAEDPARSRSTPKLLTDLSTASVARASESEKRRCMKRYRSVSQNYSRGSERSWKIHKHAMESHKTGWLGMLKKSALSNSPMNPSRKRTILRIMDDPDRSQKMNCN